MLDKMEEMPVEQVVDANKTGGLSESERGDFMAIWVVTAS